MSSRLLLPLATVLGLISCTIFGASAEIAASSTVGSKLLSKARRLNDEPDYTWVADYSIKFVGCHNTLNFRPEGGEEEGMDGSPTEHQLLVHFKLCPTGTCSKRSCGKGGEYVVEGREFIESYLESEMNAKEQNCEYVEENCYCDNANDDQACLYQCFTDAGLDYCIDYEEQDNDNDMEIERFFECEAVNDNNNYYGNNLYVGAYCSKNHKSIYIGAFSDGQCSNRVDPSKYKTLTGYDLPYTDESIVSNECISCQEPEEWNENNNNDQQDQDNVIELCEELYERSAKCEKKLKNVIDYPSVGACDYIHKILPKLEAASKPGPSTSNILMWVFFVTTVIACVYAYLLYRRLKRKNGIDLAAQNGGVVA